MGSGSQCDGTGRDVRGMRVLVLVIAWALLSTLTSMGGGRGQGRQGRRGGGQGKEERSSSVSLRW